MNTNKLKQKLPAGGLRMAAMDLDGTLLTGGKTITLRTQQALEAIVRAGIIPVFVTGRPLHGLPNGLQAMPGFRYVITSNGAVTCDLLHNEILRGVYIPRETAAAIAELPESRSLTYCVLSNGLGFGPEWSYQRQLSYFRGTPIEEYIRRSRRTVASMDTWMADAGDIENIWIQTNTRAERDALAEMISQTYGLRTVFTAPCDVEIGHPDAEKGAALTVLAESLGIRMEEVIAFGDNDNDLGMLRAAGISVAMGNAEAAALQAADFTTDTNEQDGVAAVLEQIVRSL